MSDNYRELDGIEVDGTPVKFNAANVLTNVGGVFVVDDTLSISGAAADAKKTGDEIRALKEDLNTVWFSPSTSPGYWSATGGIETPGNTEKEVYTEWLIPYGDTIAYSISYPEGKNSWICVEYEFSDGTSQRVILLNSYVVTHKDTFTVPSGVTRLSLSYRTYGDCTFAICGIFKEFKRFEYGASTLSNLELVETITSVSDRRWNWSANTLNGLYVLVAEMASSDYKYSIISNGSMYDAINNYAIRVIYVNNSKINFYISPSASAGHKLHIYKINEGQFLNLLAMNSTASYPLTLDVSKYYYHMRTWDKGFDNLLPYNTRVSSDVFRYSGKFKISLADTTNYKVAIQGWNLRTRDTDFDSGWQSDGYEFIVMSPCCFVVVLAKNDNSRINIEDIPSGLVKVEAVEIATDTTFSWSDIDLINAKIDAIQTAEITALSGAVDSNKIHTLRDLRNTSPIYDHLFVNDGINAIIPHESLYHLRLSKALGYRIIEANTQATSDGVIVVNHFSSGKFGNYFHHVDGVTDISNIDVSTVTWAWIVDNVRYNSTIPKYRTRPPRLEEFLEECNRQNMIPFVYSGTTGAIAMADKYMGHYNYICYGGTRELCPYGIIFTWNTTNTTKEQILATCDAIGSPMIYGLGNPQSFTDAELLEIVEALHAKGYAVSTSYQDTNWAKYRGMGFDFNGSQTMINRIEDGNICNYSTIFGWDDFNLTGSPTNDDNVLTFANSGTIAPKLSEDTYPVSGYDFEIIFNGQINVESNGIGGKKTFTSDGSSPVFYSCPVLNSKPIIAILVPANTTVYDLYFKATRFY